MPESRMYCKGDAAAGLGISTKKLKALIKMYKVPVIVARTRSYIEAGQFDRLRTILADLRNKTDAGLDLNLSLSKVRFLITRYEVPTVLIGTREYLDGDGRAALKAANDAFTANRSEAMTAASVA